MPKRHAEKRRTSTCRFADRVARVSVDKYHDLKNLLKDAKPRSIGVGTAASDADIAAVVKRSDGDDDDYGNDDDRFACVATIVAHSRADQRLAVLAMGVGTKFLAESVLENEMGSSTTDSSSGVSAGYGRRVRDCHAEVLARRAFRRQVTLEMLDTVQRKNRGGGSDGRCAPLVGPELRILAQCNKEDGPKEKVAFRFKIREGVTLHMYTSSAPCGNAVLKKFGTMKRERFCDEYGPNEWPTSGHDHIEGHSIRLGQFVLLVKKDNSNKSTESRSTEANSALPGRKPDEFESKKQKNPWPVTDTDEWCPPGTTIVNYGKGSTHTCSDKILRWNMLGLQGSLLSSMMEEAVLKTEQVPGLFISTLTVGRKLTEAMCRRAVCCRAGKDARCTPVPTGRNSGQGVSKKPVPAHVQFFVNHPCIMGTSVYLDENGSIDIDDNAPREKGQDVRFHSTRTWAWWPSIVEDNGDVEVHGAHPRNKIVELIDGSTGFAENNSGQKGQIESRLCTRSLTSLFLKLRQARSVTHTSPGDTQIDPEDRFALRDFLETKRKISPDYELYKNKLMNEHQIFRQWMRRSYRLAPAKKEEEGS